LNLLGKKAADVGEVTGRCTLQPDGIMAQASWERLAEVTSGRISSPQGLAATCKDLGNKWGITKSGGGSWFGA